uniref:cytochrome c oxidase subunit II n=1 Tax=Kuphus polythalamius TaxID=1049060 RepID=UPI0020281170|nr:cytochrome c oxidase subunit II [Kuphus polythalamius]UPX89194.1 cytochrome c oxidase subunit 2 [Kuphus polythalamius]UPX89206.1 cytochrome c oxidase subunit 2 [Kuphus polythalamius]
MVQATKYGILDPMTFNCSRLISYHDMVMVVGTAVMMIVVYFLLFAICRRWLLDGYSCRFKTKCNWLEFCWTLIPGGILGVLGYFSWENLYYMELTDKADYHVKVIGHQWYWEYEYFLDFFSHSVPTGVDGAEDSFVDSLVSTNSSAELTKVSLPKAAFGEYKEEVGSAVFEKVKNSELPLMADPLSYMSGVWGSMGLDSGLLGMVEMKSSSIGGSAQMSYDSYIVDISPYRSMEWWDDNDSAGELPFLGQGSADNVLYLPVNKTTELTVCTADVIHSWGVQSLGVKMDAVPGRANHLGIHPYRVGYAYGNCYELCGYGHSVMPITVLVLPESEFLSALGRMTYRAVTS